MIKRPPTDLIPYEALAPLDSQDRPESVHMRPLLPLASRTLRLRLYSALLALHVLLLHLVFLLFLSFITIAHIHVNVIAVVLRRRRMHHNILRVVTHIPTTLPYTRVSSSRTGVIFLIFGTGVRTTITIIFVVVPDLLVAGPSGWGRCSAHCAAAEIVRVRCGGHG